MDSIIELQRQTHEEIEHYERALYTILSKSQTTHETRLQTEHKASQILDRISSRVVTLNNFYQDQESRKAEMDLLSSAANPNDLSEFYTRFGKIQEHHAKYPESAANGFELELAVFLDDVEEEAGDEEYEEDDRECLYSSMLPWRSKLFQQRSHCYSRVKSSTGNILTCMQTTLRIVISKTLGSGLDIFSILTSFSLHSL